MILSVFGLDTCAGSTGVDVTGVCCAGVTGAVYAGFAAGAVSVRCAAGALSVVCPPRNDGLVLV